MEVSFVIKTSQMNILQQHVKDICKLFEVKVELQVDPNSKEEDGIQWVHITNGNERARDSAKTYIIALCDPEIRERVSFLGFPVFIFKAFEERCKNSVEKNCGIVLSVDDDGWMNVQGTNIGVTLATSKIHHLNKLHKDKSTDKFHDEAMTFDRYVEALPEKKELQDLSSSLKKEILELLDVPVEVTNKILAPLPVQETLAPVLNPKVVGPKSPEIIEINDSVITISSGSEESDEDEEEGDVGPSLAADGIQGDNNKYLLPPNFVIKEWLKVHYEGTNDPSNYVSKLEMLQHFKHHFDLPDHPELANTFFDKLAVRIFPQDPNYRSVKTKKTKNKQSRRRLVCLRRKTVSEGDKEEVAPGPAGQNVKSVVTDWNANRTIPKEIRMDTVAEAKPAPVPTASPRKTIPTPFQPTGLLPTPQQQPLPPPPHILMAQTGPPRAGNLQNWLSQERQRQPTMQPVQPRPPPNIQKKQKSIEYHVSQMSNHELIHKPRPRPDPNLRPIVIDGSNIAMSHGNKFNFSCRGIAICARVFMERGHGSITCFVPNYRKGGRGNPPSNDSQLLMDLEKIGVLKCTPSRRVAGVNIVCYDDRFIVELAEANGGVILSNDQYRDLMMQNQRWRPIVEQRLLQFTMVNDLLMLPEDPLGRNGPPLQEFLKNQPDRPAPPERRIGPAQMSPQGAAAAIRLPGPAMQLAQRPKPRSLEDAKQHIIADMMKVFPDQEDAIRRVIHDHPTEHRIDRLMNYLLISETGS